MVPCILFEDEHLLVINKPAGMNTHAPSPYAGEGIYDWFKHREPRWAQLAILHRLDKETSGVMVFGKTPAANRSLTAQFTGRSVKKKYLLLTSGKAPRKELVIKSRIARAGDRYRTSTNGEPGETRFVPGSSAAPVASAVAVEAEPLTGRTHQIRVHAAENGFPILGDALYGGAPFSRVCLHAMELRFQHPLDGRELVFRAPIDFLKSVSAQLRESVIDPQRTDAYRVIHGASDGQPGWYVEQLGSNLLSQSPGPIADPQLTLLKSGLSSSPDAEPRSALSVYHKILNRQVRRTATSEASPQLVCGIEAPPRFAIRENDVQFELSFNEGYSVGIFLDQRDNRRRLLTGHVGAGFELPLLARGGAVRSEVLNTFAYTCGFSVCAAKVGARTTSLDLSKKYLEWGHRNFVLNGIDPAAHDFIYGDTFDWLRRFAKKGRLFDVVILDPPTFSQSKETGIFRVEKDFGRLTTTALSVLKPGGVLLASSNAADWMPENFVAAVLDAITGARRKVLKQHYVPQPLDFPISRGEPAYLKTLWVQVS